MNNLKRQVVEQTCSPHGQPSSFFRKGVINRNQSNLLCDECINTLNSNEWLSIGGVFRFLNELLTTEQNEIHRCRVRFWQQLQRDYARISNMLIELQHLMEELLNSIQESEIISTLRQTYLDQEITTEQIIELAQLISTHIDVDRNGKYKLDRHVPIQQQPSFIQANGILRIQNEAMEMLSRRLAVIGNVQIQRAEYNLQTQQFNIQRQSTQTIPLGNRCQYVCLNHNETQLVVAVGQQIVICRLSQMREWIKQEPPLIGHTDLIRQVKFNHDSTLIASCGDDMRILIWKKQQYSDWYISSELKKHTNWVNSICFNHDSTLLASGSADYKIHIYSRVNGGWEWHQELKTHTDFVFDVCFNHRSTKLASASGDNTIILWQVDNRGKWTVDQILLGHNKQVNGVSFNSDSTRLVSSSWDSTSKIWQPDMQQIWKCNKTLIKHANVVTSAQFNRQSNAIVSSSWDKSIRIWRLNNGNNWECTEMADKHRGYVNNVLINNDSSMLISCSDDGAIMIHNLIQ